MRKRLRRCYHKYITDQIETYYFDGVFSCSEGPLCQEAVCLDMTLCLPSIKLPARHRGWCTPFFLLSPLSSPLPQYQNPSIRAQLSSIHRRSTTCESRIHTSYHSSTSNSSILHQVNKSFWPVFFTHTLTLSLSFLNFFFFFLPDSSLGSL